MFHFGWFVGKGYSPHGWNQPWTGTIGNDWMQPDIYMDLARGLERACFDCLVIEDGSFVPDAFQGSPEWYLRNGSAVPKSDPLPLVPLLAYVTKHVGIVATITTSFYPPYIAARLGATLDHLTQGRVGFNVVTGAVVLSQAFERGVRILSVEKGRVIFQHDGGTSAADIPIQPLR